MKHGYSAHKRRSELLHQETKFRGVKPSALCPIVTQNIRKNFADEQFDWEIEELVDEIRERIEQLEQRGISRTILKKLFIAVH